MSGFNELDDLRRQLEARLSRREKGERGYVPGREDMTRLEALELLVHKAAAAEAPLRREGINTHIHTSESFSAFDSPAQAVWRAWKEGVAILGINDHYTLAGHEEFGRAAAIAGIQPLFSVEVVTTWREARDLGLTVNDPHNPGRTYVCAKGITRYPQPGDPVARDLARVVKAVVERSRKITEKIDVLIQERLGMQSCFTFERVLDLTPRGLVTERHVALGLARLLEQSFQGKRRFSKAVERLTGARPPDFDSPDAPLLEEFLRARLIKKGGAAYVEEDERAFLPLERAVEMAYELGAIPVYPVLGNPITPWEEDLKVLLDRVEAAGFLALEVIPDRNDWDRLWDILNAAKNRDFCVFNGTEHNTSRCGPLVDRWFFKREFRPWFEWSAHVLLGHQWVGRLGGSPFLRRGRRPELRELAELAEIGRYIIEKGRRAAAGNGGEK